MANVLKTMPFIWEPFPYFKIVSSSVIVVITFGAPSKVERAVKVNTSKTWGGPLHWGLKLLENFVSIFFFLFIHNIFHVCTPTCQYNLSRHSWALWHSLYMWRPIRINIFLILLSRRMLLTLANYLWYIEDILLSKDEIFCVPCAVLTFRSNLRAS